MHEFESDSASYFYYFGATIQPIYRNKVNKYQFYFTGITFADGPLWREHRQFTVKHLRNIGFGKTGMEREIQSELSNILNYIDKNNDKAINPKSVLPAAVMNVLWKYVAGKY